MYRNSMLKSLTCIAHCKRFLCTKLPLGAFVGRAVHHLMRSVQTFHVSAFAVLTVIIPEFFQPFSHSTSVKHRASVKLRSNARVKVWAVFTGA